MKGNNSTPTFLSDVEKGLGYVGEWNGLLGDEEHAISADFGEQENVAEQQRPIGFHRTTFDS